MFQFKRPTLALAALAAVVPMCVAPAPAHAGESVKVVLDATVRPTLSVLPGLRGGPGRRVAAVEDPRGERSDFVAGEVLISTEGGADLDALLARYDGAVVYDGAVPVAAGSGPAGPTWHVVRIELALSPADDLAQNLAALLDLEGDYRFTSEAAARTAAAVARERLAGFTVDLNWSFAPDEVLEHTDGNGGNVDFARMFWMTEDDDPSTPQIDGLSTGVVAAWEYLEYQGLPVLDPWTSTVQGVAIVDNGFALDESTGEPDLGNMDYFDTLAAPLQFDLIEGDDTAGGRGVPDFDWHGQKMFGVAAAYSHNLYGAAGTAGRYGRPTLIRMDYSVAHTIPALATAVAIGADVVNMSYGGYCNALCRIGLWWVDFGDRLESAHDDHRMVLVASAGNDTRDLDGFTFIPCELEHVLCVGAMDPNAMADPISNFDGAVDIWAPTGIRSTVDPVSELNAPGIDQLAISGGTSSAAAWVSGVAALLKALEPALYGDDVRDVLRFTANPGADAKVGVQGFVDAFRAALVAKPNQRPVPEITFPLDGTAMPYRGTASVRVRPGDPESDQHRHDFFALGGSIEVYASFDGLLCRMDAATPFCPLPDVSPALQSITAVVTDPYGSTGSDAITVDFTNQPPLASISSPADGAVFGDDQRISLRGVAIDPEDHLLVSLWTSSLDGTLGQGDEWTGFLSQGTHTLSFKAWDFHSLMASESIVVHVLPGTGAPSALIYAPDEGTPSVDGVFQLQGEGLDPQDGVLPGTALVWTSSRDGVLGTGRNLGVTLSAGSCAPRHHVITLTVTDADGNAASTSVNVYVGAVC